MAVFTNRTYGVEMEVIFAGTRQDLADAINAEFSNRGIEASAFDAGYSHVANANNIWKIVRDGSVARGWEVVSPILHGESGFEQIRAVTFALNEIGCTVNRDTGMHVHHGMNGLSPKQVGQVFGTYAAFQQLLDFAVSPSRRRGGRNSMWAVGVPTAVTNDGDDKWNDVHTMRQALNKLNATKGDSRYSAVNHDSFNPNSPTGQCHGTIEFRQHQGTINADKVITWVLITQAIIENAAQFKPRFPKSTQGMGSNFKKGELVRFKTFLRINPTYNDGNANEHYVWAFKQLRKTVKKFAANATTAEGARFLLG